MHCHVLIGRRKQDKMLGFIVGNSTWNIKLICKTTQIQTMCSNVLCLQVPFPNEAVDFPDTVCKWSLLGGMNKTKTNNQAVMSPVTGGEMK